MLFLHFSRHFFFQMAYSRYILILFEFFSLIASSEEIRRQRPREGLFFANFYTNAISSHDLRKPFGRPWLSSRTSRAQYLKVNPGCRGSLHPIHSKLASIDDVSPSPHSQPECDRHSSLLHADIDTLQEVLEAIIEEKWAAAMGMMDDSFTNHLHQQHEGIESTFGELHAKHIVGGFSVVLRLPEQGVALRLQVDCKTSPPPRPEISLSAI